MTQQEIKAKLAAIHAQLANDAKKGALCVTLAQGGQARELDRWLLVQKAYDLQDMLPDMPIPIRCPKKYHP